MATTIVNPGSNNNSDNNGMGFLVGGILLIVFAVLFFVYALPYIRGLSSNGNGGVQVNVPKSIDVNVNQAK